MEDEIKKNDGADADTEDIVGPNEVVARSLDGTRFYLYNYQAGGHRAFLRSGGGSVCKPVVDLELQFYEALVPKFPQLLPFVPQFLGKVKVKLTTTTPNGSSALTALPESVRAVQNGSLDSMDPLAAPTTIHRGSNRKKRRLDVSSQLDTSSLLSGYSAKLWQQERTSPIKPKGDSDITLARTDSGVTKDYLLLGDLTRQYRRPCVLDVKMGTRQHGEDASPAKVISHTAKCAATTSLVLGLRLCGMQIYDERDGTYTVCDKTWGRKLKPDDIEPALETYLTNGSSIRWNALEELLFKMRQLKSVLTNTTGLRCWGSSLLLIYEGDQSYNPPNADVRLIDFAHCQISASLDTPDEGMLLGLTNIDKYLCNIASRNPREVTTAASASPTAIANLGR